MRQWGLVAITALMLPEGMARADQEKATLLVTHLYCFGCSSKVAEALQGVPGVRFQGKIAPGRDKPVRAIVQLDTARSDIGDVAKVVAAAPTPHRDKAAPTTAIALQSAGDAATEQKVQEALRKVKGVDAMASKVVRGEIHVKLSDQGGAKLADIRNALRLAGLIR